MPWTRDAGPLWVWNLTSLQTQAGSGPILIGISKRGGGGWWWILGWLVGWGMGLGEGERHNSLCKQGSKEKKKQTEMAKLAFLG